MRSIKFGILALYLLLFAWYSFKDLDFDKEWDVAEYADSIVGLCAGILSVGLAFACTLTSAGIKNISVKLDEEAINALVKAFKEQVDNEKGKNNEND